MWYGFWMGDIIEFKKPENEPKTDNTLERCEDSEGPMTNGPGMCFDCWHRFDLVRPFGSFNTECPKCGKELVLRYGRFGKFISCSGFPECRHTEPLLEKIGVTCPQDGGDIVQRKTRKGRTFYGCHNYPECDFTSWKRPIEQPCPNCEGLLIIRNKREVQCIKCDETFLQDILIPESAR